MLTASRSLSVRDALQSVWMSAEELTSQYVLSRTIKELRGIATPDVLAKILGVDVRACRKRLAQADGRTLAKRAFADLLPRVATPRAAKKRWLAGRYEPLGRTHEGGMAVLHEALDHGSKPTQKVVLKWARDGADLDDALAGEFRRSRGLVHTNLVKYLAEHRDEHGGRFLVLEHAGTSLDSRLRSSGPLGWDEIVDVLGQAASALDYLVEQKNIAHLDVTPRNIAVDAQGVVRLLDFGIARRLREKLEGTITLTSTQHYGSRLYQAPEVGRKRGVRADQYSLAVVALAMRHGPAEVERAFKSEGGLDVLTQRRDDAPLRRALRMDPDKRFQSCTEFVTALAEATQSRSWIRRWLAALG